MRASNTAKTFIPGLQSTHTGAVDLSVSAIFLMLSFPAAVAENNRIDDMTIVRKRIILTANFAHQLSGIHLHGLQAIFNVRTVPATCFAHKLSRVDLQHPWDIQNLSHVHAPTCKELSSAWLPRPGEVHDLSPVKAAQLAQNPCAHASNQCCSFII